MSVKTHFENIQEEIESELFKAEKQILVAVAWLTNQRLFDILCIQADNFIDVQVLIVKDEINSRSGIDYEKLVKVGGKLYWQENASQSLMHHKFCIIDKKTVITGSYNWTNKAQTNIENIIVLENETNTSKGYLNEFINLVPKFQEAIFFDAGYKSADYFNTPEKRLEWFNNVPRNLKDTFIYYGRQLIWTYDSEGYVILNENLDDNIAAIFRVREMIYSMERDCTTLSYLENLSNLEELTVTGRGNIEKNDRISDLSPLRNLIKLKELKISAQNISDLTPLSKLKKLETLDLSLNNISSLRGLENLKNLKTLYLGRNKIHALDELSNCSKLEDFRFEDNFVERIDFLSNNKNLKRVEFGNNLVKDIKPLALCTRLNNVTFNNNLVEDMDSLLELKFLEAYYPDGNPIQKEKSGFYIKYKRWPVGIRFSRDRINY